MKKTLSLVLLLLITGCSKEYYCDNGDTLKGTTCVTKNTTPPQVQYYCSKSGYHLSEDRCISDFGGYYAISIMADKKYYCTSGYLKGNYCIIETTYNAYER